MSVTLKRKSNINDIYNIGHVNIDLKDIIKEIQVDKKDDIIYAMMVLMGLQSFDIILDKDSNQNSFLNFTGETLDYYDNKEYLEKDVFIFELADEDDVDEEIIENTEDL